MDTNSFSEIDRRAEALKDKLIAWRRDFHEHPELSSREHRTGTIVAEHLRALGLEVEAPVAHTGVVALLRGGKPGPVVALRADMMHCLSRRKAIFRLPRKPNRNTKAMPCPSCTLAATTHTRQS